MHRVIFFGMEGAYATVPLRMLAASDLRPILVIQGVEKSPISPAPVHEVVTAQPGLVDRMMKTLGREALLSKGQLVDTAHRFGINVLKTSDVNGMRARALIARLSADAFAIAGFPQLLKQETLKLARLGGLNLHPGRLPQERGASPLFWALKEGRTTIVYNIHVLDLGEDSGDIVATGEITFEPGCHGMEILERCAESAAPHLLRTLRGLLRGELIRTPQSKEGIGRCPRPSFRDGQIDPDRPAVEVFTFVAGCAGRYSLFVECGGDRFFVEEAIDYDDSAKVDFEYALTGDRLILRCRPGVVEIKVKDALFTAEY